VIDSDEPPPVLLARLKTIERAMGRRRGRRWGARVIDLDIVLWSGGRWRARTLTVPHASFSERRFVLAPLAMVAGGWRDPATGRSVRQLLSLVDRRRAAP
jgi:2-amino-4-hydroxy-6-hydroxymethyldihydropteridine diphosphokinase